MNSRDPAATRQVVKAACPHDCPDTCAMQVTVENGVAVKVQGDGHAVHRRHAVHQGRALPRAHLFARTACCTRCSASGPRAARAASSASPGTRRSTRSRRASKRSPQRIRSKSCRCSYAGTMGLLQYRSMDRRFFHQLGASLLERTLCSSAGKVGMKITLGGSVGMDPEHYDEAKLILIWGSNPDRLQPAFLVARAGSEAARREADRHRSVPQPDRGEMPASTSRLLPGTDAALALGMMHVIIAEGLLDLDYIERHTLGFEAVEGTRQGISAGKSGADLRHHRRGSRERSRANTRTIKPAAIRAQLRHAAPRRRRHGGAHHRLPAGADRRAGAIRPAASCSPPPTSTGWTTRRSSAPTSSASNRARSTSRRWATR